MLVHQVLQVGDEGLRELRVELAYNIAVAMNRIHGVLFIMPHYFAILSRLSADAASIACRARFNASLCP
jgi:hypothetical protein